MLLVSALSRYGTPNVADPDPEDRSLLTIAQWAPLCRGHLARPLSAYGSTARSGGEKEANASATGPSQPVDRKIIERVEELAKKKGWTMSDVSLAWINKRITSPIIGFSKTERIEEAISGSASDKKLTEEEEKYLEELYEPKSVIGHV